MDLVLHPLVARHQVIHGGHVRRLRGLDLRDPLRLEHRIAEDRGRDHEGGVRLVHVALGELRIAPPGPVPHQLVAAAPGDSLDQHRVGAVLEHRPVPLAEDVPQVLGRGPAGGVVLAHVAEPPGELGDPLAVAGFPLPLHLQVGRLEELGPGDEGDAGLAENVHGRWCQG